MIKIKWFNFRSLSGRLLLLFFLFFFLMLFVAGLTVARVMSITFKENAQAHLVHYVEYMLDDIGSPPDVEVILKIKNSIPIDIDVVYSLDDLGLDKKPPTLGMLETRFKSRSNGVEYRTGDFKGKQYLLVKYPNYSMLFSIPDKPGNTNIKLWGPIILLLIVVFGLYFAIKQLFAPVAVLKNGLSKIGDGDLMHRIKINRRDEFGDLADHANTMADDIQDMLEAKRQLLLAISHELRTPLTRAKVSVSMLDDEQLRDELSHDLDEMEGLIADLLEAERLGGKHAVLHRRILHVKDILQDVCSSYGESIDTELNLPSVYIEADKARLILLLNNLLGNALKYSRDQNRKPILRACLGPNMSADISENISDVSKSVKIIVEDFGVGIEAEHLPHLTEAFYRVDSARLRKTGGYGLGLYLCKKIVEAHGGSLSFESQSNIGTKVIIILPLTE